MPAYQWQVLSPSEASRLLAGLPAPWWVAGGWALDLFLRRETRRHRDLDIAVLRGADPVLRSHLIDWDIKVAHDGRLWPWDGQPLEPASHILWARPIGSETWALEFLLEDHERDDWLFRRDARVRLPIDRLGRSTAEGVPYVRPEVALLYKAKYPGVDRNEADFALISENLDDGARRWLREALAITHPGHGWLKRL